MLKVLLVDDHAVVREGVAAMLGAQDDIEVVGQAGSLAEGHALLERALSAPATGKLVAVPLEGSSRMIRELNIVYRNNYRHPEVATEIRRIYHLVKEKSFPSTN